MPGVWVQVLCNTECGFLTYIGNFPFRYVSLNNWQRLVYKCTCKRRWTEQVSDHRHSCGKSQATSSKCCNTRTQVNIAIDRRISSAMALLMTIQSYSAHHCCLYCAPLLPDDESNMHGLKPRATWGVWWIWVSVCMKCRNVGYIPEWLAANQK